MEESSPSFEHEIDSYQDSDDESQLVDRELFVSGVTKRPASFKAGLN